MQRLLRLSFFQNDQSLVTELARRNPEIEDFEARKAALWWCARGG